MKKVLTSTSPFLDDRRTEGPEQGRTPKVPSQAREPEGARVTLGEGRWRGCGAPAPPQYEPILSGGYAFKKFSTNLR